MANIEISTLMKLMKNPLAVKLRLPIIFRIPREAKMAKGWFYVINATWITANSAGLILKKLIAISRKISYNCRWLLRATQRLIATKGIL